jgi:hypothetical protein
VIGFALPGAVAPVLDEVYGIVRQPDVRLKTPSHAVRTMLMATLYFVQAGRFGLALKALVHAGMIRLVARSDIARVVFAHLERRVHSACRYVRLSLAAAAKRR